MITTTSRQRYAVIVDELEALLGYGFDVGDVLAALGIDYDTLRRAVHRRGRHDLLPVLSEWSKVTVRRSLAARGLLWR